jgi:hypothetical protein
MPKPQIGQGQKALTGAGQKSEEIERTGATFLITDLDLAMTLTRIAGHAEKDSGKRNL